MPSLSRSRASLSLIAILMLAILSCKQEVDPNTDKDTIGTNKQKGNDTIPKAADPNDRDTAGKRTLYLTFDDGPNNGTQTVIDILKAENVPATFFLIGMHVKEMPASHRVMPELRAMPNVVLCNHGYTHAFKNHFERFYADLPGSVNDFIRSRDTVHFNNPIARTPGNNIWRTPKFEQTTYARYKPAVNNIRDSGFVLVGWDTEWRYRSLKLVQSVDQMQKEINDMYDHGENRAPGHCVLLMHDLTFLDAADSTSLHELIRRFKADGRYRFDVVTRHPFVR